eukprot:404077_1
MMKKKNESPNVDDESFPDIAQRKAWEKGSKCEIYSKTNETWYSGDIVGIKMEQKDEWLQVKYDADNKAKIIEISRFSHDVRDPLVMKTFNNNRIINDAAVLCVCVKDSMSEQFNESSLTKRALTIATG